MQAPEAFTVQAEAAAAAQREREAAELEAEREAILRQITALQQQMLAEEIDTLFQ